MRPPPYIPPFQLTNDSLQPRQYHCPLLGYPRRAILLPRSPHVHKCRLMQNKMQCEVGIFGLCARFGEDTRSLDESFEGSGEFRRWKDVKTLVFEALY